MRILHVNKFLYARGGAEGYMHAVADLQRDASDDVAFFGMQHPENPDLPYADLFPSYVELDPPPRTIGGRVTAAGRMLYSRSARRGMDAVLDRFRPDVVHLHNIYHQLSPSVLRPLAARGIAAVMTLHDYKLACPTYLFLDHGEPCDACLDGRYRHAIERRCKGGSLAASAMCAVELRVHTWTGAYGPVQLFLCPSRFAADRMATAGVFPDRLRVVPGFVDVAGIAAKRAPGGGVVYAGRLSHEKGVDVVIEAAARMTTPAHVDVVGDGPALADLRALAEQVAPHRVTFHGRVPRTRVLDLMRTAAVVAMPSRCYENQPLAVLEAFACGVPVVASDLGGLAELVDDGVDGLRVPANDPASLAVALDGLVADPQRAMAMGRSARARAERSFSPVDHLTALQQIYAEAASTRAPRGVSV